MKATGQKLNCVEEKSSKDIEAWERFGSVGEPRYYTAPKTATRTFEFVLRLPEAASRVHAWPTSVQV